MLPALHSLKVLFVLMSVWWKGAWVCGWTELPLSYYAQTDLIWPNNTSKKPHLNWTTSLINRKSQYGIEMILMSTINWKYQKERERFLITYFFFILGIWLVNRKLENYVDNQGYNFSKLHYNFVFCEVVCLLLDCPKSELAILPIKWTL